MVCFNKVLFILGTGQKGTFSWALYDGFRIVNWYISRTAGSNLNSKKAPIRSMTFYSISKKSEDTKAFNWKIFFQQVLSLSVTFQVNHIGLQQCWSRVCKIKDSDFTVPRCTSHCFAHFRKNIYVERKKCLQIRWADGKYVQPKFRKPIWLVQGSGYGSNCQKSYSAEVAEH